MKRFLFLVATTAISTTAARADIPVIDKTNYAVAKDTAEKTARILDTNKDILTTVEKTLQAVTGDRGSDAGSLQDIAIGTGCSVTSAASAGSRQGSSIGTPARARSARYSGSDRPG